MRIEVPFLWQYDEYSCGIKVAQMVLAYYKIPEAERNLSEALNTSQNGYTRNENLVEIFSSYGLFCFENQNGSIGQVRDLINQGFPVIVNFIEPTKDEGHFAVVIEVTGDKVILNDPGNGEGFEIGINDFEKRWHGKYDGPSHWYLAVSKKEFPTIQLNSTNLEIPKF